MNIAQLRLGDLATFQRGFDITKKEQVIGEVPVISSGGVSSYHNIHKVEGPGVVIGRKGTLGTVFYSEKPYWPHDTTLWVKDFKNNDPLFIYYYLKTLRLERFDAGAANPTLNRNHIHSLKVWAPISESRSEIANILTAYDELIDNNNQRISLLEQMAEEIYKEWFVRLRFPGHEQTRIVDGVPEGWEIVRIENAFDIIGGGTPSTKEKSYWENGTINWVTPTDITGAPGLFISEVANKITASGLSGSSAKLFPPYSVMMTSRATIGAIGINTQPACTNQGFITCLPNRHFPYTYIASWLKINRPLIDNFATGATFKEIAKTVFKRLKIPKPISSISEKYHKQVEPLYEEINILLQKNKILKQTRDLLLPRLMSGKLSVEHLLTAET